MKSKCLLGLILILAIYVMPAIAADISYKVVDVKTSGWIKGKVSYANKDLQIPSLESNLDTKTCGNDSRKIEAINLGPNGELRNVVVYLKDITAGREFKLGAKPPELNQKNCDFEPHVQVVPTFSSIKILN